MDGAPPEEEKKANPLLIILFGAGAGLALGFIGFQYLQPPQAPKQDAAPEQPAPPPARLGAVPRASLGSGQTQDPFDMIIQSPSASLEQRADPRRLSRAAQKFHSIVRRYGSQAFIEEWTREFFTYPDLAEVYRKYDADKKDPLKFAYGVLSSPNFFGMLERNLGNPNVQNIMQAGLKEPEFIDLAGEFQGTPEADKLFRNYEKMTGIPLRQIVSGEGQKLDPNKVVNDAVKQATQRARDQMQNQQR